MFTIQFKNGPKLWDVTRARLHHYVLTSENEVEAIYEQATPVTARIRKELAEAVERGTAKNATPAARRFINSRP
jgi:hypothetical protein